MATKYTLNEGFFDTFDQNSAYILGFWAADGYINKSKKSYTWGLVQKDESFLRKLAKVMDSNSPVSPKENCYQIRIYNKKLYYKMVSFGFGSDKSYSMVFPEMSYENRRHFEVVFTCGDVSFLQDLKDQLEKDAHLTGGYITHLKNTKAHQLGYSTSDCLKIRDYIYGEGDLFLNRKRDIFFNYKPNKERSRSFEITRPDQTKITVRNLSEFKRKHNLPSLATSQASRGYTVKRLT
jgi:hypothetical protein